MLPYAAPLESRESVRATAQSSRAMEQSRRDVSIRAFKLLHQSYRSRQLANLATKDQAIASVDTKFANDVADLASKHGKDTEKFEATKFALYQEFDARREAWANASNVEIEQLLADESLEHAELIESLENERLNEEEEAQEQLLLTVQELETSGQNSFR